MFTGQGTAQPENGGAAMSDETAKVRVFAYTCEDPKCPPNRRAVAHWLDAKDNLQVATQAGSSADECARKLTAFLNSEIAKANRSRSKVDPDRSAEMKRRVMIGVDNRRRRAAFNGGSDE
jgi:hypothetical protein